MRKTAALTVHVRVLRGDTTDKGGMRMAAETNGGGTAGDNGTDKLNELGAKLKELREAQGITLAHASEATKIQKKYISAIEDGDLGALPKGPYCRSFLRQYCAFLNAPDMWTKYDPLTRSGNVTLEDFKAAREEPDMSVTPGVFKRSPRMWIYLLVAASLAAAFWVTLRYRGEISTSATSPLEGGTAPIVREQQEKRAASEDVSADAAALPPEASAPASVDLSWMDGEQPAPKPSQTAAANAPAQERKPAAPARPAQPAKMPMLTLTARADSWMRISEGDKVLYQGIMKPGEKKEFRVNGPRPLRVRCGNPAATDAAWFGASAKALGGGKNPVTKYYWSDGAVTDADKR
ncbi:hypothetical protein B5F39_05735 [Cloacibacillus sp. An23]|nr:hypothetical protein B5F39_05735 [Cloacibacillus sp. An23]